MESTLEYIRGLTNANDEAEFLPSFAVGRHSITPNSTLAYIPNSFSPGPLGFNGVV